MSLGNLARFAGRLAGISKTLREKLSAEDIAKLVSYLVQFGYLNPDTVDDAKTVLDAIKILQDLIGLRPTGEPSSDFVTILTQKPRCGCPDRLLGEARGVNSWGLDELTYASLSYVDGLLPSTQDELLEEAFNSWAKVCNLRFKMVRGTTFNPNLKIYKGRGSQDGFDGPFGTLAYAYLPSRPKYTGSLVMKFDNDETWLAASTRERGILYLNVAAHEIGHLLGLDHSRERGALMAPYYDPNVEKPQKHDDIPRIQSLYGPPIAFPPDPVPPSSDELSLSDFTPEGQEKLRSWFK